MWTEIAAVVVLIVTNVVCYGAHEQSVIRAKFLGKKVPTVSLVSNRSSQRAPAVSTYWLLDQLDPGHLVDSFVLNETGVLLLRAGEAGFFVLTLLLEAFTDDGFGARPWNWWTFYTNWTFVLFGVWSAAGLYITATHTQVCMLSDVLMLTSMQALRRGAVQALVRSRLHAGKGPATPPSLQWTWLTRAYLLAHECNAGSTLFLSSFYWLILYNGGAVPIDNVLKHGVNNLVIMCDIALTRVPFCSYHFQVQLFYGSVYAVFMWVWHGLSSHWVYQILDWSKPLSVALYLVLPLFNFAAFAVWLGEAALREWLGRKYGSSLQSGPYDAEAGYAEVEGLTDEEAAPGYELRHSSSQA